MKRNVNQYLRTGYLRTGLAASLLMGSSFLFWDCSGEKKESETESSSAMTDTSSTMSGPMGREKDTLYSSSPDAPQQAPPDSASARGMTTVPAEVQVKKP
ncbi:hypothetical protein [Spirosoma sp. KUDC1026]|uniref:hypothetical protein n=1 Tax=Spirosoma sp. KUDC1026 TaxID=2745947 RepID=UPI00159BEF17|nr:hypothetical protein [Spirosoma sp. KUDC1026]QKZ14587.1 hypothetical protein HU175_18935 [Spirosoma sp. KUDC1026]